MSDETNRKELHASQAAPEAAPEAAREAADDALTLDLDDSLASWELDLDQVARAEASPIGAPEAESDELSVDALEPVTPPPVPAGASRRPPAPPPEAFSARPRAAENATAKGHGEEPREAARAQAKEQAEAKDQIEARDHVPAESEARDARWHEASTLPPETLSAPRANEADTERARPVNAQRAYEASTLPPETLTLELDDSEATVIAAAPDALLEAILHDRPSTPSTPVPEVGPETLRPRASLPALISTPLVQANPASPTPVVRASDAPLLEVSEGEGEDDTDVSERPEHRERRERIARLEALARRARADNAAELLITAGELAEELGEGAQAEGLYQRALELAPSHAPALAALARLSFRTGDLTRHAQLLERASELTGPTSERARALAQLALVRWVVQRDATAALRAATEAARLAPNQLAYALLLARIEAATYPAQLDATLIPLAERCQDGALAAMWWVAAGRAAELRGDLEGARTLYTRAASTDPYAFDAQLSLARVQHALGANQDAARALLRTLESFDIGPVAEAVRRRAAPMLGGEGAYAEAVELLEHASDDVSLRTAMQIALDSGDPALGLKAAEAWVLGSDGSERALALLTQAELLADAGELERAERSLELAALADPQQTLVAVAREALARRAGNPARLAEIVASEEAGRGALAAAAKLAAAQGNAAEELTWLNEAAESEAKGLLPELLAIDASAELARLSEVEGLLRRTSEHGSAPYRVRMLLALAETLAQRGERDDARDVLARAAELAPSYAPAARAYARTLDGEARAAVYRREAAASSGTRAAFLALRSGFSLAPNARARLDALTEAWSIEPPYAPALWALHREARKQGDLPRLAALHTREAERMSEPRARVAHLVRAALIRAGEDSEAAAEQLTRALALAPNDPILAELVIRLGDAAPGSLRAAALDRLAERAQGELKNALRLATAGVLEDEARHDEAAERYREVLRESPDDPIAALGLERATAPRGGVAARLPALRHAAEEASTERERAEALEALLLCESEPARLLDAAHALLALVPAHALGLRALERDAMARNDRPALRAVEERLIRNSRGARDRAARLRLYQLLHVLEGSDESAHDDIDPTIIEHANDAGHSQWLTRQLLSAAVAGGRRELVVRAIELLAERTNDAVELASLAVQKTWLTLAEGAPSREGALREALAGFPDHPTLLELSAEAKRAARAFEAAAEQFEEAAQKALSSERAAHLWARAAQLWDTELARPERAKVAFLRAAEKELDYPGVQERLLALLSEQSDLDGLIALTRARVEKSEAPEELVELRRKLAELYEQRGDRASARRSLREALAHDPDHLPALRDLASLAERTGEHAERAEALNALLRLSRDPLELRDTLLELAALHETALPDLARAEAAYQRALKLGPRNAQALERLALLYEREGKHALAIDTLGQLVRSLSEGDAKRAFTLKLAAWQRAYGEPRAAEELLEGLRRNVPTDREVLERLTELARANGDQAALALHLNRALSDVRHALASELAYRELWCTLVELLSERGRSDAAAQAAATARALGIEAPSLAGRPRPSSGIGAAAMSELLDDLLYPESSPVSLRVVFRHAAEALNRVAPLDLRAFAAEKLDKRHPLRTVLAEQARWASRDVEVYVTSELPNAFVPVQDSPVQLLVGRALLDTLDPDEQRFLVARALKLARANMSIACRLPPAELELWLHALVRSQVASHTPTFVETTTLEEAARRVGKQLKRGLQQELAPHLLELTYAGMPRFDAASVYGVASTAASRAGLLALGDVRAALSALWKLSGSATEPLVPKELAAFDEARELVTFAISDAFFEARARAGKEAR